MALPSFILAKPVAEAILNIEDMGRRGEGFARHDSGPVHVAGALPCEIVRADVLEGHGHLLEILTSSPDRIEPFCKHFGQCGGCQLQHWREDLYRTWKLGLVEAALRQRGIETEASALIDAHGMGRRRIAIHVRKMGNSITAGLMAPRSHTLVDIDNCPILVPALASAFDAAREIGAAIGNCDVAITASDTGLDVHVKAERGKSLNSHRSLAGLANDRELARLTLNNDTIAMRQMPSVAMGRARVAIPPNSFLQATSAGEQALAAFALEALARAKKVADLFCGCGPFALRIAENAKVTAYDSDKDAIDALHLAAKTTPGLKPVTVERRDLFREPLTAKELKSYDAVVLDPPRAGAEAQARQLAKSGVKSIVSVSCDAGSFARDARILIDGGYKLVRISGVDQFKWTSHVEIAGLFGRF